MPDVTMFARWLSIAPVLVLGGVIALAGLLTLLAALHGRGGTLALALMVLLAGAALLPQVTALTVGTGPLAQVGEQAAQVLRAFTVLQAALR
ncbi:MAG: hypothetical protein AB1816_18060 [Bacillota bacterium]